MSRCFVIDLYIHCKKKKKKKATKIPKKEEKKVPSVVTIASPFI